MEEENASETIADSELLRLIHIVQKKDSQAMLQLIDLFKNDILHVSKFIYSPQEDAISQIIVEFLEYIQLNELE
ncbi:hypothetical protein [Paenibacillus brasilensis]|uniref:Helix-turn-helix conjugative transposon-like domain-containing protein n=1 Tax=Paenibacillus brasilensis TaxID=128574 RepID=A0ABU0KSW9_9BACL|nr:hypothetical protein [Paenibacillus brasilensis]MDQ0492527.1 hypothetical protein [Paenibacillus brasilensis]